MRADSAANEAMTNRCCGCQTDCNGCANSKAKLAVIICRGADVGAGLRPAPTDFVPQAVAQPANGGRSTLESTSQIVDPEGRGFSPAVNRRKRGALAPEAAPF